MQNIIDLYNQTRSIFDLYYDVHLCSIDEANSLIDFIDKYWQKGHIFTKSRELFDWQHYDIVHNRYNFVLATHKKTNEIHGLIGFILSSIFDENITTPIRWGAIWKIREDVAIKGLGVFLKGYMEENVPASFVGGVGLSNYSKSIDRKLGERMGVLKQYYILNPQIQEYKIVKNTETIITNKILSERKVIFKSMSIDEFIDKRELFEKKIVPYKSLFYYVNRYFKHPIYRYKCVEIIKENEKEREVFFYRVCSAEERNFIFLVDYIGDGSFLPGTYSRFCDLLFDEKAECVSFPCEGIDESYLCDAGFRDRDSSDVIIPVYFEPFVCKNIDLDYHFWPKDSKFILVKGDADQDRPNSL